MVCNHFVAFSVCCCVIITEFARYNEKNWRRYPVVDEALAAFLWNSSVSAQRLFCRLPPFRRYAPFFEALEIFCPKL